MKGAGAARFVVASVAIHALAAAILLRLRLPTLVWRPTPIAVEITRAPAAPPSSARPAEQRPILPAPTAERPVRPPGRRPPPTAPPAAPSAPLRAEGHATEPATSPPAPSAPPPAPRRIDLFSPSAIQLALPSTPPGPTRDPSGVTRRAGDGQGDPNLRDVVADREEASARVHEFFDGARNDERLKSGRVAPRWREAERQLATEFHPVVDDISDDNAGKAFFKQWLAKATAGAHGPAATATEDPTRSGGGAPRGLDPSTEAGFLGGGGAPPGGPPPFTLRLRTEVEVVVASDGRILSSRLLARSGRRTFDQQALAAVRQAVERGGAPEEGSAVVTRWSVEAWLNVAPPAPVMGFAFDEVTGKVDLNHPLKKTVQTKVALLSVTPRR